MNSIIRYKVSVAKSSHECAVAWGMAQLINECDKNLSVSAALEAADVEISRLQNDIRYAQEVKNNLLASSLDETGIESDDVFASMLESRVRAWATFLSIDEAYYLSYARSQPECQKLGYKIEQLARLGQDLTEALEISPEYMKWVKSSHYAANWRGNIKTMHAEPKWLGY